MLPIIKKILVLLLITGLTFSCTSTPAKNTEAASLTPEQKTAFEAFTSLQISSDEKNRLYSTFPGIDQPCYPPDTSIVITQSELLNAMQHFVKKHYTYLPAHESEKLINAAVLVQSEYTVLHCPGDTSDINYENGLPMQGTWIMPRVLNRTDVTLVW